MRFDRLPLDRKLILAMLMTSGAALVLAAAAFIAHAYFDYRRSAVQQVRALGGVTAANTAGALAFDDPLDAAETLRALRAERQVQVAALFDSTGRLFATYPAGLQPSDLPARLGRPGASLR